MSSKKKRLLKRKACKEAIDGTDFLVVILRKMFRKFRFVARVNSHFLKVLLVTFIILSVGSAGLAYWLAGEEAKSSLVEQTLHREQVVVRAGAHSIESFLELASKSLSLLAKDYYIVNQGPDTQMVLDDFLADWQDTPIVETMITDGKGTVTHIANTGSTGIREGISVANRDYFKASKEAEEGEVFYGRPILPRLGAFEGQYIVPIATPIYSGGEFKGVLGVAILLSDLTETYLEPLKISENTRIYLVNIEGVMLHAPYEKFVGVNYFDYLSQNPFEGSERAVVQLKKAVEKAEEGKLDLVLPNERAGGLTRFLIAQTPVKLNGGHWTLAVATPEEDAYVFFWRFHAQQSLVLALFIFVVLAITAIGILAARLMQREAYIKGFTDARDHKDKSKI